MILTFEETCEKLRDCVRDGTIEGWNHRDCAQRGVDIYTINLGPGNVPQTVEWTQARVENFLRTLYRARELFRGIN